MSTFSPRQHVQLEIGLMNQIGRDFAKSEIVHVEQKCLGSRQTGRQMAAHAARLAQHIDDVEREQQILPQLLHAIVRVDLPD